MDLDDRTYEHLMDTGASSVRFNAPMDDERAIRIGDFVAASGSTAVDIGCGHGALAIDIAERHPGVAVVGVDTDAGAVERARVAADGRNVGDRVTFRVGDAAESAPAADVALCVGSSHALGGPVATMNRLAVLAGSAVVGDLVWTAAPEPDHRDLFGDLPDGEHGLAALATAAGWRVAEASRSSLEEWDAFEGGWIDGVRRIATPEAEGFAVERQAMYERYRGVAGFGWVHLSR